MVPYMLSAFPDYRSFEFSSLELSEDDDADDEEL
jgi:hypothetical protein